MQGQPAGNPGAGYTSPPGGGWVPSAAPKLVKPQAVMWALHLHKFTILFKDRAWGLWWLHRPGLDCSVSVSVTAWREPIYSAVPPLWEYNCNVAPGPAATCVLSIRLPLTGAEATKPKTTDLPHLLRGEETQPRSGLHWYQLLSCHHAVQWMPTRLHLALMAIFPFTHYHASDCTSLPFINRNLNCNKAITCDSATYWLA